jgi:hypothetical protein
MSDQFSEDVMSIFHQTLSLKAPIKCAFDALSDLTGNYDLFHQQQQTKVSGVYSPSF